MVFYFFSNDLCLIILLPTASGNWFYILGNDENLDRKTKTKKKVAENDKEVEEEVINIIIWKVIGIEKKKRILEIHRRGWNNGSDRKMGRNTKKNDLEEK